MENQVKLSAHQEAGVKVAGSLFMLIVAITMTLSWLGRLVGLLMAPWTVFDVLGPINWGLLSVIGCWLIWIFGHMRKPNTSGLKMLKAVITIEVIFTIISFILTVIGCIFSLMTFNIFALIDLLVAILTFVFTMIYMSSIKKSIKSAINAYTNKPYKAGGLFASVIIIIAASLNLARGILDAVGDGGVIGFILNLAKDVDFLKEIATAIQGIMLTVKIFAIVGAVLEFLSRIAVAIVMLHLMKALHDALQKEPFPEPIAAKAQPVQPQPVQQTVVQQAAASTDADELAKYKKLYDAGAITQEEYEAKKKQILGL
jgi:hypothetical protein